MTTDKGSVHYSVAPLNLDLGISNQLCRVAIPKTFKSDFKHISLGKQFTYPLLKPLVNESFISSFQLYVVHGNNFIWKQLPRIVLCLLWISRHLP